MVEPPKVLNFVESLFLFYTFIIHQISYCTHINCGNFVKLVEFEILENSSDWHHLKRWTRRFFLILTQSLADKVFELVSYHG